MTEPLPNARSIWVSAASRARCFSPSSLPTSFNADCAMPCTLYPTIPPIGRAQPPDPSQDSDVPASFYVRNMFFFGLRPDLTWLVSGERGGRRRLPAAALRLGESHRLGVQRGLRGAFRILRLEQGPLRVEQSQKVRG